MQLPLLRALSQKREHITGQSNDVTNPVMSRIQRVTELLRIRIDRGVICRSAMQITELLQRVHSGDQQTLHAVIPLVYGELKKLGAGHPRGEAKVRSLETTALAHEAFLRLAKGQHPSCESPSHFYGIASRLMRQVLVDMARARAAEKRSAMEEVQLAQLPDLGRQPDESLLAMNDALEQLARTDPLKVQLVDMRYFGGMTAEESAAALSISVQVVRRELRLAQAWLHRELAG